MDAANILTATTAVLAVLASSTVSIYTLRRTAKSSQEGRMEQRSADAYLKILSLAEAEAAYFDACIFNFGLRHDDYYDQMVERRRPPKPEAAERAATGALLAAFASAGVRSAHDAWRKVADDLAQDIEETSIVANLNGDVEIDKKHVRRLADEHQPKECEARRMLGEAVAAELGHRRIR